MPSVYPKASDAPEAVTAFDETACVAKVIEMREADGKVTLEQAIGVLLEVSGGTVGDVKRVWDEIEAERQAMASVPLQDEGAYLEALSAVADKLDPFIWIAGMREKLGVAEIVAPKES